MTEMQGSSLFHYTSPDALLGIIGSRQLWATQIQYLNDSKEFNHAVDIASNHVAGLLMRGLNTPFLDALYKSLENFHAARRFVVSFSESADSLSQWRAYARGGGYSIGFDKERLVELAKMQCFTLVKCIYDESKQYSMISSIVDKANEISQLKNELRNGDDNLKIANEYFRKEFMDIAPLIKHPAFCEEKEWRLLGGPFSYKLADAGWRPSNGMIIPYYSFHLSYQNDFLPINEIVVGPHPFLNESASSLTAFVNSNPQFLRLSGVNVKKTCAPFRE